MEILEGYDLAIKTLISILAAKPDDVADAETYVELLEQIKNEVKETLKKLGHEL